MLMKNEMQTVPAANEYQNHHPRPLTARNKHIGELESEGDSAR
jgi:hypothetical protein